jgi:hypothetical protein
MARIQQLEEKNLNRTSVHDPIDATYTIFDHDNNKFLQIDTCGRNTRQIPGKKSQTIQLDRKVAAQLFDILRGAFKF